MELRLLRYYLAVADELSFSAAARRLHVSQSSLSRAVRQLEEEIGVDLLIRGGGGVGLTPEGDRLIDLANDIVDRADAAVLELRRMGAGESRRLEVGYITPALDSFLQDALEVAETRFPDLELFLNDLPPHAQSEHLSSGKLDIAFIGSACPELPACFDLFTVCEIPLRAAVSSRHPMANRRSIRLEECAEETFVGLREDTFPGRKQVVVSACRQAGFRPAFAHEADSLNSLGSLIARGKGITLMPADRRSLLPPRVRLLPIRSPRCSIEFTAAVAKDESRPAVRAFLQECRELATLRMRELG